MLKVKRAANGNVVFTLSGRLEASNSCEVVATVNGRALCSETARDTSAPGWRFKESDVTGVHDFRLSRHDPAAADSSSTAPAQGAVRTDEMLQRLQRVGTDVRRLLRSAMRSNGLKQLA